MKMKHKNKTHQQNGPGRATNATFYIPLKTWFAKSMSKMETQITPTIHQG
jgi:hypothetical protein